MWHKRHLTIPAAKRHLLRNVSTPKPPMAFTEKVDTEWWVGPVCGSKLLTPMEKPLLIPRLMRNPPPPKMNDNIFLIDSACNSHPKYRAWCSVESWARQNPGLDVWFLQTAAAIDNLDGFPSHLLQHYTNIKLSGMDLVRMFNNTPLNTLFESKRWLAKNTWPINHLSDMSRVLALWHWGGTYSDTDVLCLKNYTLPFNTVGLQSAAIISNSFLSFTHHHPFLWKLMEDMSAHFNPVAWGSMGPHSVTRVINKMCPGIKLTLEDAPHHCRPHNITIQHPSAFSPIPWPEYRKYFTYKGGKGMNKTLANSYTIHIWNKMSKGEIARVGSGSIYDNAAKLYCPVTYHHAGLRSNTF